MQRLAATPCSSRGLGGASLALGWLAILLVAIAPMWSGEIAVATPPENDIAEFIVNIARHTSWPDSSSPKSLFVCYGYGGATPPDKLIAPNDWSVKGMSVE